MTRPLNITFDDKGIATVTLQRPEVHNAFNDDLIWELDNAFKQLGADSNVRAIVLTGAGKSFSAGGDLNWMREAANYTKEQNERDALALSNMLACINECPKPTLAIVNGAAYGGGAGLVACCDIAIAVSCATFSLSEVRLGLTPATISPYVIAAIGARQARRFFITAERFSAAEALTIGLVHQTAPSLQEAFKLASSHITNILTGGPDAQTEAKRLIRHVAGREITEGLRTETASLIAARRASAEGKEGVTAFLEKRPAAWVKS